MLEKLLYPSDKKILVIGDVIQDYYIYGEAERISPEAPVPIIKKTYEEYKLGGAANVYQNLVTLGAKCEIISVIGNDKAGCQLSDMIKGEYFFRFDDTKVTPVKTRIVANEQQLVRIDNETTTSISDQIAKELLAHIQNELDDCCLIILSDYGKGVLTNEIFVEEIIFLANKENIPIFIDPHNGNGMFEHFRNATLIKVNKKQSVTLGCGGNSIEQTLELLIKTYNLKMAMMTLSEDGLAIKEKNEPMHHIVNKVREIFDVTGAGDSTLAAFAYAVSVGISPKDSAHIANIAGNVAVQHQGTYAVTISDLVSVVNNKNTKIIEKIDLTNIRKNNKKIVFTNGCFDHLHPGHVEMLGYAKQQGDILVVGMNSDTSVQALKGPTRPIINQIDRAKMLTALSCVDYVYIFDELSPQKTIESLCPDVHVKGNDHTNETDGVPLTLFFERIGGYSTTKLIRP